MRSSRLGLLVWIAAIGVPITGLQAAGYSPTPELSPTSQQERRLVQGLFDVRRGRLDDAIRNVSVLVEQEPDFLLAHLVYGDLLLAQIGPLPGFGYRFRRDLVSGHLEEARARLARYVASPPPVAVPESLLRLPPSVPAAIIVDMSAYRLYLFENRNGRFVRTRDFYVSIGKSGPDKRREGDDKTPIGVYLVDSFLSGDRLPDMYGPGAFPINYPNGWDRAMGRTGGGIWIHGTDSQSYSRPPLSSRGCVSLSNEDFAALERRVEVGRTPVIVTRSIRWVQPEEVERVRRELETALDEWRRDWESRDVERYLSHYAPDFRADGMSREAFARHKRRVNESKSFIDVELGEVAVFRYPDDPDLVLVDFLQQYSSNNFRAAKRKHQYWRRNGHGWQIVLEESVSSPISIPATAISAR